MKHSRTVNKQCSIACAMDVVGDRWSILLLREAYYGTRRFDEFQYYLGVATNILSARLKKLLRGSWSCSVLTLTTISPSTASVT